MVNEIISKLRKVVKLDIIKVFSFTSVSTLVKMIAGFISVKVVAMIIGPAGVALVGQLNNFSSVIMSIATGGITVGVTKYIAQYKNDDDSQRGYISTAVKITLFFSVISGLFLIFCASILSKKILLDSKYSFVFIVFGITLIFYTFNSLLQAVVNGYKQYNLYIRISITSSLIGLLLSLLLVIPFGVNGAFLNAVTSQSFVCIIAIVIVRKRKERFLAKDYIWNTFDAYKAKQLFQFAVMHLVSAFSSPVSQLIIRSYIINHFSIQSAGIWEGINRLSSAYLMIITSSFGVYYLPKLSELTDPDDIKKEIWMAYKVIIPCLFIGLSLVYFCRFTIIKILFSPEFFEMSDLILWRLIGDFFKISSWLIAYIMIAKSMTKLFISTEIIFATLYIFLSIILTGVMGLQGVIVAYAINYLIYSLVMYVCIYKNIKNK